MRLSAHAMWTSRGRRMELGARLLFVVSLSVAVVATTRALTRDAVPESKPSGSVISLTRPSATEPSSDHALRRDPFLPPGVTLARVDAPEAEQTPADAPARTLARLVGTVVQQDGRSFAICDLGDGPPRIAYVGDRLGDLRLTRVAQGRADFATPAGERITLAVDTLRYR